ncbi:MAG: PepSY-associated TM helix domain-containing protein [Actinomycetota bacterium]
MSHTVLPAEPEAPPARPPAMPRGGWVGALLLRLHFYAGILVGPFLLVAALSGALYALTPQLEQVVYAHQLHAPAGGEALSLAAQIEAADAHAGPGATLSAVRPAPEQGETTRIMYAEEGLGPSESRAVFVDPATGEIRGDLVVYGTSGSTPLRTWVSTLHRSLHLGDVGRLYSELAASWLGIVALAGLALWIARARRARARGDLLRPNRSHRGHRALFGWHASIGIWVLLGALFLSATGITWSQYAGGNVSALRAALDWGTPSVTTSLDEEGVTADPHAHHHGPLAPSTGAANPATFDAVLAISRRANIDTGFVEITPPAAPGTAWTVREIKTSFPTEGDSIAIDGTSMQVVDRVDFRDFPLPAKLASWGIGLHMGVLFGVVNQIVLFALALGIAALVVLGYAMWVRRRPAKGAGRLTGRPPSRVGLDAPWWGIMAAAGTAVLIGIWLPLVGWTLLGFVVLDTLIGFVASRRA